MKGIKGTEPGFLPPQRQHDEEVRVEKEQRRKKRDGSFCRRNLCEGKVSACSVSGPVKGHIVTCVLYKLRLCSDWEDVMEEKKKRNIN